MRVILLFISIILFQCCGVCCAENNRESLRESLRQSDAIGQIVYGKKIYYIVTIADLKKIRKYPPTYVGTIEHYHLFRVWLKIKDTPDEISYYAVKKNDCVVDDEKSPEEETSIISATRKGHRVFEIKDGKCFVEGWNGIVPDAGK